MAFCGNCGNKMGKNEKFCPGCGAAKNTIVVPQKEQGGHGTSSPDMSFLKVSSTEDAIALFREYFLNIILKRFALFTGRARRREFWMFALIDLIIGVIFAILSAIPIIGAIFNFASWIFMLAICIPSFALGIRRLHDTNRSGINILLVLIPIVGLVILLVWAAKEGTAGENKYGPDPKAQ